MIVHQLVAQQGRTAFAKCGYHLHLSEPLSTQFSAFDSRVTCENCKPIKQPEDGPKTVRIKVRRKK